MGHRKQLAPPHPGQVLGQYIEGLSVSEVARALNVSRSTVSRILGGASGISADMAIRLGLAMGTSPDLWAGLQMKYDLHHASRQRRLNIKRLSGLVKDQSVHGLKGMFSPPRGRKISIEDMRMVSEIRSSLEEVKAGKVQPYVFGPSKR